MPKNKNVNQHICNLVDDNNENEDDRIFVFFVVLQPASLEMSFNFLSMSVRIFNCTR
jgi:hypothetical protein